MEKILTIVVPTYNAEKYLRDNLASFCIPRLLPYLEVLVINDGSTDRSSDIAEEYVKRYPYTYKLITKENGGHGSGINTGILNATGKYFKIVDADDWVEEEPFVRLVETLRKSDSDIVASGFYWVYDEGQADKAEFARKPEMKVPFLGVDYQKKYVFDEIADQLYIKMHHMTIKTAILKEHKIEIDEHCYYVDTEYITYPIPYVNTIEFVDGFVYMYRLGRQGQSVSMEKMQSNEKNYDREMESLLAFYANLECQSSCSQKKRQYIARVIARVAAGKIKIMLSFPPTSSKKASLIEFDNYLKLSYPAIYYNNVNSSLRLLRYSHYLLYTAASILVRRKYK